MPLNIGSPVDFNQNETQNPRLHNLASSPGAPVVGQYWFNSTDGFIYYKDAVSNKQLVHYTQLLAMRLDQFVAPNTFLNIGSQRLTSVADPLNPQDAATKAYVDALMQGLKWKDAVRVSTTGNITLSGLQTIDGISVATGDRVAVVGQTTATQNGIYVASSGAWVRSTDADSAAEVFGMCFFVSEGTSGGNKQMVCTTDAPITLGSTALSFAVIGGGVTYTAGAGITLAGSTISLDMAVAVRKAFANIGNGSLTSFSVTHNIGSSLITCSLIKNSTGQIWLADIVLNNANQLTVNFGFIPSANEFLIAIHG